MCFISFQFEQKKHVNSDDYMSHISMKKDKQIHFTTHKMVTRDD